MEKFQALQYVLCLYVELFGCCGEREQQRPQSLCVCVFTLSTTARTVHRSSFSFFGEETLYYRGYVQKYAYRVNPNFQY